MQLTEDGQALLARTWPMVTGIDAAAVGLAPGDGVTLNRMLHTVLRAPEQPVAAGTGPRGQPDPGGLGAHEVDRGTRGSRELATSHR
jgi:hypothetical protein